MLRRMPADFSQFLRRNNPGFVCRKNPAPPPGRVGLGGLTRLIVQLKKGVLPLGRSCKQNPALARKQHRADDFIKHIRFDLGVFIQHHPVGIRAAQRVGIIRPQQPNLGSVGQQGTKFAFLQFYFGQRRAVAFEIVPRNQFDLF